MSDKFLIPVTVRPLLVSDFGPAVQCTISLCVQICWAAGLRDGEPVTLDNQSTGRKYRARVRFGAPREVRLEGAPDPGLRKGDILVLVAHELRSSPPVRPGAGTVCRCEKNQVVEIRHWSAPPLPDAPALVD